MTTFTRVNYILEQLLEMIFRYMYAASIQIQSKLSDNIK